MSKSSWGRFSELLVVLVGGVLLSGCSGEENIPLKKVDFVLDTPKDYKEQRKDFLPGPGSSARMKRDPSGVSQ
jgi:hypothetical protein